MQGRVGCGCWTSQSITYWLCSCNSARSVCNFPSMNWVIRWAEITPLYGELFIFEQTAARLCSASPRTQSVTDVGKERSKFQVVANTHLSRSLLKTRCFYSKKPTVCQKDQLQNTPSLFCKHPPPFERLHIVPYLWCVSFRELAALTSWPPKI